MAQIKEAITRIKSENNGEYVVIGNFNVDVSKMNHQAKKLNQMMNNKSLKQIITGPSRVTNRTSSQIDLTYTDMSYIKDSGTVNMNISDHFSIFIIKKKPREKKETKEILARSYKNFDTLKFNDDIQNIDRNYIFSQDDPNEAWGRLHTHIAMVIDAHCQVRKLKVTIDRPNYLNDELLHLMNDRDKAFKKARKTENDQLLSS